MSDRPTPETDAHLLGGSYSLDGEFARNLERQRDEAREQLDRICRDGFGYQDTIGGEACSDYVLRKLNEEREELGWLRVANDHSWQALDDLEKVTELARELRDALERVINHGHADDCFFLNRANGECDCGVDDASAIINKSREVLP